MINRTLAPALKKAFFAAAAVFSLVRCSEDEVVAPSNEAAVEQTVSASSVVKPSITSLTISGINTSFATAKDCKTCTFVVPAGTSIVNGKELGLGAGSIICLNSAFQYGALELTNIEGTEESPVVIMTVGENLEEQTVEATSTSDPY